MLTLVKHVAHVVPTAQLMVGDVVATKGTTNAPQRLRRVDLIGEGEILVSTPRSGKDVEVFVSDTAIVCGRVEEHAAATTAKPKTKRAAKPKAAPVKVTKVDAVAQTTPTPIHGKVTHATGRKMTPQPKAASSVRELIRTELRSAVQALILDEVKAAIAEALA